MNPQHDEHLRDSAPDNSRFDGFDRGDLGRPELIDIDGLVDDPRADAAADFDKIEKRLVDANLSTRVVQAPRDPGKPSLASRLMARLGAFAGKLRKAAAEQMPTASHFAQHYNPDRNSERATCRELGRRQYRRQTRTSYALKRTATPRA